MDQTLQTSTGQRICGLHQDIIDLTWTMDLIWISFCEPQLDMWFVDLNRYIMLLFPMFKLEWSLMWQKCNCSLHICVSRYKSFHMCTVTFLLFSTVCLWLYLTYFMRFKLDMKSFMSYNEPHPRTSWTSHGSHFANLNLTSDLWTSPGHLEPHLD